MATRLTQPLAEICFRVNDHLSGNSNGENGHEHGDDCNGDDDSDDDEDDADEENTFNVNYGVVTAIRALAVKGTTHIERLQGGSMTRITLK